MKEKIYLGKIKYTYILIDWVQGQRAFVRPE